MDAQALPAMPGTIQVHRHGAQAAGTSVTDVGRRKTKHMTSISRALSRQVSARIDWDIAELR
jgi:hypothetical protein